MKIFAHIISAIFHPLLLPTYTIFLLVAYTPSLFGRISFAEHGIFNTFILSLVGEVAIRPIVLTFFLTVFFPVFILFLMRQLDFIDGFFKVSDKKQQVLVFIPLSFMFMWSYIVFLKSPYPPIVAKIMLGATITLCSMLVMNAAFDKISAHALGMGAFFAAILFVSVNISVYDMSLVLTIVLLLAGLVGTAQLVLKNHQLNEVYNGYTIGFICMAFSLIFGVG